MYKCALAFIIFSSNQRLMKHVPLHTHSTTSINDIYTYAAFHDSYPWHLYMAPFPWQCQDHAFRDTLKVCVGVKHSNVCHSIFSNISSVFVSVIASELVYIFAIHSLFGASLSLSHVTHTKSTLTSTWQFTATIFSSTFPLFLQHFVLLQGIGFNNRLSLFCLHVHLI